YSGMARIPAANTLATTIKAIIGTPPWGPLVFLIGVAFPIIVLLVIFWQLFWERRMPLSIHIRLS
ncbi:MAG: hypothetical protein WCC54_10570, partial [Pseudolabrys sp.]